MKVIILCGGKGTRMGNDELPKVLFPIGGKPILWHLMKFYAQYGFNDFVLCLGYKGHLIKEYFQKQIEWKIAFADTGLNTNTGGRIKKIEGLIDTQTFLATYGDGLSNINLHQLIKHHQKHKKIATITVARPHSSFGIVGVNANTSLVTHFEEKPILDHWINGGFFVFERNIFDYLKQSDVLEKQSFLRILKNKEISAFKHQGFWKCMDTYKDNLELNELWKMNNAAWRIWKK